MVKFPEASARLFGNIFVCKKCKTKIRAPISQILKKRVACRRCGCKSLRAIKKARVKA